MRKCKHNFELGTKINCWTIIGRDYESLKTKGQGGLWLCRCDCGTIRSLGTYHLQKTVQCQKCDGKSQNRRGNKSCFWKGYEEISHTFYRQIVRAAKIRGLKFDIGIEDLWDLYLKQNRRCAITGVEIGFVTQDIIKTQKEMQTASLDRIDPTKEYSLENVQWVHKRINIMKLDLSQEEFINFCILAHLNMNT